jgi:hypothetical protein
MIGFKFVKQPDALRTEAVIKAAVANLEKAEPEMTMSVAIGIADDIKRSLYEQTANLAPLSPATLAKKRDPRILIDTQKYVSSIQAERAGRGADVTGDIIGLLHEVGSVNMPARPHIGPAMARAGKNPVSDETIRKILDAIFGG